MENIKVTKLDDNWCWEQLCSSPTSSQEQKSEEQKSEEQMDECDDCEECEDWNTENLQDLWNRIDEWKKQDPKNPPLSEDEKKSDRNISGTTSKTTDKQFSYADNDIDISTNNMTKEEKDRFDRMNYWFSNNIKLCPDYKQFGKKTEIANPSSLSEGLVALEVPTASLKNIWTPPVAPSQKPIEKKKNISKKEIWNEGLTNLFMQIISESSLPISVNRMLAKSLASNASDILAKNEMFSWIMEEQENEKELSVQYPDVVQVHPKPNVIIVDNPMCPGTIPNCEQKSKSALNQQFFNTCVRDFELEEHGVSDPEDIISKCADCKDRTPEEKKQYAQRMIKKYGLA